MQNNKWKERSSKISKVTETTEKVVEAFTPKVEEKQCLITESRLCANIHCKKHWRDSTPKVESWEEEFDAETFRIGKKTDWSLVKSFIASKIEEARVMALNEGWVQGTDKWEAVFKYGRQSTLKEVMEMVEKQRVEMARMTQSTRYSFIFDDLSTALQSKLTETK